MKPGDDRPTRTGSQSVERALAVLRCFERAPSLGGTEVAAATGLTVSTAFRLLRALKAGGLLAQDAETERFHLAYQAVVLGRLAAERLGLSAARPALERLAAATGEAVNVGVLDGREVLVVMAIQSPHPLRFEQGPGARNPAHVCAMGKVLLATRPDADHVGAELARYTPSTITSHRALLDELRRVRRAGYAVNLEERTVGVRAIAAPVRAASGAVVAAVALQGPAVRLTDAELPALVDKLLATTAELSELDVTFATPA